MKKSKTSPKTSRSDSQKTEKRGCLFCTTKTTPDYKDVDVLKRFVSDRERIYGRKRSGLCAKHQRRVAVAIKRARHLGLL